MPLAPRAQRAGKTQSLQILEDLRKIKAEDNEAVERLDNELHSAHVKQEPHLDKKENSYGSSSSSELSELEDTGSDATPISGKNEEARPAIDEPQKRSTRRTNAAKTYTEPDSSSEDVGVRQKGRGIAVKNTWALNGSEESEIDSSASYTSEGGSDSSGNESKVSTFSQGIQGEETEGEIDAGLDDDSLDEHSDRLESFPLERHDNEQGKRNRISEAKFKYMVTHGTLNEVQRSKPWEVIAEECGVTASLENISQALKQAGIPHGDRLRPRLRAAPSRDEDGVSVPRSLSSQPSKSSTQNSGSPTLKLTARDLELVVVAFQCLKDRRTFQINYGKLADLAGLKNPASGSAAWSVVRKKLSSNASPRLTAREVEVLGLAFRSLIDGYVIQIDQNRFAELAGFSSAWSGNASWLVVKKKLMAGPSHVALASPAAATNLHKRKHPASTIILEDSESEGVMPTLKKRRENVLASRKTNGSPESHEWHPYSKLSRGINSNMEKSRRLTAPLPPAVDMVEPVLHKSNEPLTPGANEELMIRNRNINIDNLPTASKEPTTMNVATATNGFVARAFATVSPTNDNNSKGFTTSKSVAMSDLQKKKNIVWNLQAEHMLLLAIVEVSGHKIDYEAIAERLGCTGNAVSHHLSKLRKEARGRNDLIPLGRLQNVTKPIVWTNRPQITEAAAKSDDSTVRFPKTVPFPKPSLTKDALFIKNEIAKLEAKLGDNSELAPWSEEEVSALERGLRRFSGPYWGDILALFGPNGSVSDVLKDRDDAQLENKACRMKISFLKSGVRFPFYLRLVTGGRQKVAPTVVVDDGKGETGAGEDHGQKLLPTVVVDDGKGETVAGVDHDHATGGVTVTPEEGNIPMDLGTAGEGVVASVAPAAFEHAIDVSTTS